MTKINLRIESDNLKNHIPELFWNDMEKKVDTKINSHGISLDKFDLNIQGEDFYTITMEATADNENFIFHHKEEKINLDHTQEVIRGMINKMIEAINQNHDKQNSHR